MALKKLHMSVTTGRALPKSAREQEPLPPSDGGKTRGSMICFVDGQYRFLWRLVLSKVELTSEYCW